MSEPSSPCARLGLRRAEAEDGETAAWFLPGSAAGEWLEEVARWPVSSSLPTLLAIPASIRDPRAIGALVLLPPASVGAPAGGRAQPYLRCGARLFYPRGSRLDPDISAEEADQLFPTGLAVFHPSSGLVRFEDRDRLQVADLLAPPPCRRADWSGARPGPPGRPPLLGVVAQRRLSAAQILSEARGDIGSEEGPEEPPPRSSPEEGGSDWLARLGARLKDGLARLSGESVEPPKPEQLEDIEGRRRRRLEELLSLFERDPDAGLRRALPLTGGPGRGRARPGADLPERSLDFDASRLRGGGAVDVWGVHPAIRAELERRYREAARREMTLGRYRRAAYIYAELLGEDDEAGSALRAGGHFRDAAVLYLERLDKPQEAARCYELGGYFDEALPLYDGLGQHLKVGEILSKLERPEEARAAFLRAFSAHRQRGELIAAATILEDRLGEWQRAGELLRSAWPDTRRAAACLRACFATWARHDDGERRRRLITELRDAPCPRRRALELATILGELAADPSAEAEPRRCAAEAARAFIGRRLRSSSRPEADVLTRIVVELEPTDQLLRRDGQRFRDLAAGSSRAVRTRRRGAPTLNQQFMLGGGSMWTAAVGGAGALYVIGLGARGPIAARVRREGQQERLEWPLWAVEDSERYLREQPRVLLAPSLGRRLPTAVKIIGAPDLAMRSFAADPQAPSSSVIGTLPSLPRRCKALCGDERRQQIWALSDRASGATAFLLSAWNPEGHLGTWDLSRAFADPQEPGGIGPPSLIEPSGAGVFVAAGRRVVLLEPSGLASCKLSLVDPPEALLALDGRRGVWLAVSQRRGFVLASAAEPERSRLYATHLRAPRLAQSSDGYLIAVSESGGWIGRFEDDELVRPGEFPAPAGPVLAACRGPEPRSFAIVDRSGMVSLYLTPA